MSVINQMLKDLDKRQTEQQADAANVEAQAQLDYPTVTDRQSNAVNWRSISLLLISAVLVGSLIFNYPLTLNWISGQKVSPAVAVKMNTNTEREAETTPNQSKQVQIATHQEKNKSQENTELQEKAKPQQKAVPEARPVAVSQTDNSQPTIIAADSAVTQQASQLAVEPSNSVVSEASQVTQNVPDEVPVKVAFERAQPIKTAQPSASSLTSANQVDSSPDTSASEQGIKTPSQFSISAASEIKPADNVSQIKNQASTSPLLSIEQTQLDNDTVAQQLLAKAIKQFESGLFAQAKQNLEKAQALQPSLHQARARLAALHYGERNPSMALAILKQGLQLFPEQTSYLVMQSRIWSELGYQQQALASIEAHSPAEPNAEFYHFRADLAQQQNNWALALQDWLELSVLQPNNAKYVLGIAISSDQLGRNTAALEAYLTAIRSGQLNRVSLQYARQRAQYLESKQ